jgi:hypothetical protein
MQKLNEAVMVSMINSPTGKLKKERSKFVKWKMNEKELKEWVEENQINKAKMQKEKSDLISYLCDNSQNYGETPSTATHKSRNGYSILF